MANGGNDQKKLAPREGSSKRQIVKIDAEVMFIDFRSGPRAKREHHGER